MTLKDNDILDRTYIKDTSLTPDSLEARDFLHQLGKSLAGALSPAIMPFKQLREPVFDVFFSFIHQEYDKLFVRSNGSKIEPGLKDDDLIDRMT